MVTTAAAFLSLTHWIKRYDKIIRGGRPVKIRIPNWVVTQRTVFIISAFTRTMCSGRASPSAFMPLRTIVSARESLIHFCIGDERRCPYVSLWSSGDLFDRVNDLVCDRPIHCPTAIIVIALTADIANKPCQLIKSRGIPPRGTSRQPLADQVNLMLIFVQRRTRKQMQGVPFVYDLFHGEKGLQLRHGCA